MRLSLPLLSIAASLLAAPAHAQANPPAGACADLEETRPTVERLEALTREYHPEALTPANLHSSLVVAIVVDQNCRVLAHATTHRPAEHLTVQTTLEQLFPDVQTASFLVGGIAELATDSTRAPGRPWLVWAVVRN